MAMDAQTNDETELLDRAVAEFAAAIKVWRRSQALDG
jgi:hypothetical protein